MPELSVVLCTHNPREGHLGQTLEGLRQQTLSPRRWELVVVDNASDPPLAGRLDLRWHPLARVVGEPRLGLTIARLRGLQESAAPILVYVDDDNVLCRTYLEDSLELAATYPKLGAWGGTIELRFDEPPPAWTEPYWKMLTRKSVEADCINQDVNNFGVTPFGAGLCVRRAVALRYAENLERSPWRRQLDRKGRSLMFAGDLDLATTACDLGMDKGVFRRLRVEHLIPPERLSESYLLRLNAAMEFSNWAIWWCRDPDRLPEPWTLRRWWKYLRKLQRMPSRKRRFHRARMRAQRKALRMRRVLQREHAEIDLTRLLEPKRPSIRPRGSRGEQETGGGASTPRPIRRP